MVPGGVKSAMRVLEIFEHFAATRAPASVTEISRALGYPQSSTSVLLRSLIALGYMDYDAVTRRYMPNLRLALLTTWIEADAFRDEALIRRLERLREASGDTVLLGQRNGVNSQYVVVLDGFRADSAHMKWGTLRPLTRTAVGRVLLARESDADVRRIVRRINTEMPQYRLDEKTVLDIVDDVRAKGFASTMGDMMPGRGVVAVPVPDPPGGRPMAVGIGAMLEYMGDGRRDELLGLLRSTFEAPELATAPPRRRATKTREERNHA